MTLFAIRLKNLRDENNITQIELASAIGVNQSAIALWERGKSEPTASNIKAAAEFFDVSADYLLGLVDY